MNNEVRGIVKWFSDARGYGFVHEGEDSPEEYFVHYSAIDMEGFKTLKQDQEVVFTLKKTDKGVQAANVRVVA